MTWLELLSLGRRMPGNQRTAIARMLHHLDDPHRTRPARLHGVSTTRYRVDPRARTLDEALQTHLQRRGSRYILRAEAKKLHRHDGPGWMEESFTTLFHLTDRRTATTHTLDLDAAEAWLTNARRSPLKIWSELHAYAVRPFRWSSW